MNKPERVEGPTPNGGDYALVHYQDSEGAPVEREDAVKGLIIEYSANGKPIAIMTLEDLDESGLSSTEG